ncbi:NmrA family transcriptional regulator [bacterium]|nr:MAG: NmrA family transcriptional regulator [bacterium]
MIVVTTPTGSIGHLVVEDLLLKGAPVRVIVRDPSRLHAEVRDRVEIFAGSHSDPAVLAEAFAGADALFWLVPPNPRAESLEAAYVEFTRPAVAALQNAGVRRAVSVSALGRGTSWRDRAGLVSASLDADDLLASAGIAFRALTMPSFMDNLLRQAGSIRDQGVFFSPISEDLKLPTCATADIASAAVRLLLDDSWSGQGETPVLGPEDLSHREMAEIASDVLGRPVRYQRVTFEAFESGLKESGMTPAFVRGYVDMMRAKDEGMDNAEPRTPESTTPTSFRQWCETELKPAVQPL